MASGPAVRVPQGIRRKWSRDENMDILRCFFIATAVPSRGYRARMHGEWQNIRPDIVITEQGLADRVRYIRKNKLFTKVEEESLEREVKQQLSLPLASWDAPPDNSDSIPGQHTEEHVVPLSTNTECGAAPIMDGEMLASGDLRYVSGVCGHSSVDGAVVVDDAHSNSGTACNASRVTDAACGGATPGVAAVDAGDAVDFAPNTLDAHVDNEGAEDIAHTAYPAGGVPAPVAAAVDLGPPRTLDAHFDNEGDKDIAHTVHSIYMVWKDVEPNEHPPLPTPRKVPAKRIDSITKSVNRILPAVCSFIEAHRPFGVREANTVMYSAARYILARCSVALRDDNANTHSKKPRANKPQWEIDLERQIKLTRAEVSRLTALSKQPDPKQSRLWSRYNLPDIDSLRGLLEQHKAQLLALAARLRRRKEEAKIKSTRVLFETNERQFYRELRGGPHTSEQASELPTAEQIQAYWEEIWSVPVAFAPGNWLARQRQEMDGAIAAQPDPVITEDILQTALASTRLWGAAGRDGIQGYWLKRLTAMHSYLLKAFNDILNGESQVPAWMVEGRTVLLPKTTPPSDNPAKYRPITCLSVMYKTLTSCINALMNLHIKSNNILASEQRGCTAGSRGCKEQLLINAMVCDDARRSMKNLFITWIDFRKAFDSLSHECILAVLELYGFHGNVINFMRQSMAHWCTIMSLNIEGAGATTERIRIARGIFQGDSLSPLLFCLCLNVISSELKQSRMGYVISSPTMKVTVSHLWFMDDLKVYARTRGQVQSMTDTVRMMGAEMGLHFGLDKCATLSIMRGQVQDLGSIGPDHSVIDSLAPGDQYKYLGLLELQDTLHEQMKKRMIAEYSGRVSSVLDSNLCAKDTVKAINTYAVPVLLYGFGIVKWTKKETDTMDVITRKLMTQRGMHHPKASVERMYIGRRKGGRGLLNLKQMHAQCMVSLARYMSDATTSTLRMLRYYHDEVMASCNSVTRQAERYLRDVDCWSDNTLYSIGKEELKQKREVMRQDKVLQMPLHGQYWKRQDALEVASTVYTWMFSRHLKPTTEGTIIAAQDQALRTRNYEYAVMKSRSRDEAKCRLCGDHLETVDHIVSACPVLAKTSYIRRHDSIVRYLHWCLCRKMGVVGAGTSHYSHRLSPIVEVGQWRLMWEFPVPTDLPLQHNRPDLIIRDDESGSALLVDASVPLDHNIRKKAARKRLDYGPLCLELKRLWRIECRVVPVIIGALGTHEPELGDMLTLFGEARVATVQQLALCGTARILRQVLAG